MKIIHYLLLTCILASSCSRQVSLREVIDFTQDWKFTLSDSAMDASSPAFDDGAWRTLNLPHDWSIESDFSEKFPATAGGGALPGGIGWYRKTFLYLSPSKINAYMSISTVFIAIVKFGSMVIISANDLMDTSRSAMN